MASLLFCVEICGQNWIIYEKLLHGFQWTCAIVSERQTAQSNRTHLKSHKILMTHYVCVRQWWQYTCEHYETRELLNQISLVWFASSPIRRTDSIKRIFMCMGFVKHKIWIMCLVFRQNRTRFDKLWHTSCELVCGCDMSSYVCASRWNSPSRKWNMCHWFYLICSVNNFLWMQQTFITKLVTRSEVHRVLSCMQSGVRKESIYYWFSWKSGAFVTIIQLN